MGKITSLFSNIRSEEEEDRIFINAILTCSNAPISHILSRYENGIKKMIWYKKFSYLESNEIYSEGLTRVVDKIKKGKFRGDSSISTYLNRTCLHICLDEIHKRNLDEKHREWTKCIEKDNEMEEQSEYFQKLELVNKMKEKIGEKCRELIDLRFNTQQKKCLEFCEIAKMLNINADSAKHQLYRCLEKIRELIVLDPVLREYIL